MWFCEEYELLPFYGFTLIEYTIFRHRICMILGSRASYLFPRNMVVSFQLKDILKQIIEDP